jgi:hypothetical protein
MGISALRMLGLAWDIKVAKVRQPLPPEEQAASQDDALALPGEAIA